MKILFTIILFSTIINSFIFAQQVDTSRVDKQFDSFSEYSIKRENDYVNFYTSSGKDSSKYVQHSIELFNKEINYKLLAGTGLIFLSAGTYLHNIQSNAWWSVSDRFHTESGQKRLLNIDNISHFYGVNLLGHLFSGGYEASGMQSLESTWYSSLSALSYEVYIELEDAYHQGQGFSNYNLGADLLGTAFYIGQYYLPSLKSFLPKFSYQPSYELRKNHRIIFDDYAGQKYWLAIRAKEFVPEEIKNLWPSFINIAIGTGSNNNVSREISGVYLALDLDTEELPLYGPFWQFVKNTFNYFHFPMPGIRITPSGVTAFLLCF